MRIVLIYPTKLSKEKVLVSTESADRTDGTTHDGDERLKLLVFFAYVSPNTTVVLELPAKDAERALKRVAEVNSKQTDPSRHVRASVALDRNYNLVDCRNPTKELLVTRCPFGAPGLIKASEASGDITISDQMVQDYRADLLEKTTYCNEAEAYLLSQKLGTSFVICEADENVLQVVIRVGVGPEGYLLHGFNHYTVLERDDRGTYTLNGVKFKSGLRTRVDGSCLLDACHIASKRVNASDREIAEYRSWLSQNLDASVIRATLTTILIDSLRGIAVAGLGPLTQKHYDAVPHRDRALRVINGSPNPRVHATATHALRLEINKHRGPLVFRRHVPSLPPVAEPRGGKQSGKAVKRGPEAATSSSAQKAAGKTLAEDPVTLNAIAQALGQPDNSLSNADGVFKDMGAYTLVCSCDCKTCVWAMLEIRIVPIELVDVDPVEVLLGTEFSFTNEGIKSAATAADVIESPANRAAQDAWYEALTHSRLKDQAGAVEMVVRGTGDDESRHVKITYQDGWWFQVSLDVSCLELQACPITLAEAASMQGRIQADIFNFARSRQLVTDSMVGGGHIHLGLAYTFQGDARLFRNFVVDLYNHPLVMEVLDNDPVNAPVLAQLPDRCRTAFAQLLQKHDASITSLPARQDGTKLILKFAEDMRRLVLTVCHQPEFTPVSKLQAISFERIAEDVEVQSQTLEIRAIRAQRSAAEFTLIGRLFEARLNYLRRSCAFPKKLIPYEKKTRGRNMSDRKSIENEWTAYLSACQLDPTEYAAMLKANLDERPKPGSDYWRLFEELREYPPG